MSNEPTDIAPHVDATWLDGLVVELRLRDVPGDVIGDVLAEVDAHVVDSGTSARDAFGDPTAYAAQIAETTARPTPDDPRDMLPIALGGAALVVAVDGVVEWFGDGTVDVTGGTLALVLTMLCMPSVLQRYGTPVLRRLFAASFWRIWLCAMAVMGAMVGLALLARPWHLVALPAAPVAVVALTALVVTALVVGRSGPMMNPDPLLAPGSDPGAARAEARRELRRTVLLLTGAQVGILVLVVGLTVLLTRPGG